jgi:hypothetical protein
MHKDIKTLGWFWGTIHTILKQNPKMTIAEALGEGQFWECKTENCHQPFPTERSLRQYFTQSHAAYTQEGWEAAARCLNQSWSQIAEETAEAEAGAGAVAEASEASGRSDREAQNRRNVGEVHDAEQRGVPAPVPVQVAEQRQVIASGSEEVGERGRRREEQNAQQIERAPPPAAAIAMKGRVRRNHGPRVNPALQRERQEAQRMNEEKRRRQEEFRRKREHYEANISRGVNIPHLNSDQMQRVKSGLNGLFRFDLN